MRSCFLISLLDFFVNMYIFAKKHKAFIVNFYKLLK